MEMKMSMRYVNFFSTLIETAGYNAQCALLEVRLTADGRVCRYREVPEEIWYRFREHTSPDTYYRRYICGCFPEECFTLSEGIHMIRNDRYEDIGLNMQQHGQISDK